MTADGIIAIRGLRVHGHHGVLPEERANGQVFVVDAVVTIDVSKAATTDDLTETIDYSDLAKRLAAIVEGEPLDLIETLTARLVDECLSDVRVARAEVTVHKPEAPIGLPVEDVSVTIARGR